MYIVEFLHNSNLEFSVIYTSHTSPMTVCLVSGDFSYSFYTPKLPWFSIVLDGFFLHVRDSELCSCSDTVLFSTIQQVDA